MKNVAKIVLIVFFFLQLSSGFAASEFASNCISTGSISWQPQEMWVWEQICNNKEADLFDYAELGLSEEPWEIEEREWSQRQIIRPEFLYDILLHEPYVSTIENLSIQVFGAWFTEPLFFRGISIDNFLALRSSRFDEAFSIQSGEITKRLSVNSSWFKDEFTLFDIATRELNLNGARFDDDATILVNADGYIGMGRAHFSGYLNMAATRAQNIAFQIAGDPTSWGENARLSLRGAQSRRFGEVESSWIGMKGKVDLQSYVYDQFSGDYSRELSRNIGTTAERPIQSLISFLEIQQDREEIYIPQPYDQLASVLSEVGQASKADQVLYAKNEYRRTHKTTPIGDRVWLTIKKIVIGYGYQTWLTIIWLVVLVIVGALTLRMTRQGRELSFAQSFLYSLDQSIPLVNLQPSHEEIARNHASQLRSYFLGHQVLSLILLSFLGAGLAGAIG